MSDVYFNRSTGTWQIDSVDVTVHTDNFLDGAPYVALGTTGVLPDGRHWIVIEIALDPSKTCTLSVGIEVPLAEETYILPLVAVQALRNS